MKHTHIAFIVFTFWVTPVICSGDLYLQELEAEAEDSVKVKNNTPSVPGVRRQAPAVQKKQTIEFESQLAKQFPTEYSATYDTYKKLNANEKAMVVGAYFASGKNMTKATQLLFNIYFRLGKHATH